jgi:hypothetical protein
MVILPDFLNEYTDHGVLMRVEGDIIYIEGIRSDVDLVQLEADLVNNWEEFFKRELLFSINDSCIRKLELYRPPDFQDLLVKASLGILSQEEREVLTSYYTNINTLRAFCEELKQEVMDSDLSQISQINLPEWVNWDPLPTNPVFIIKARTSDISE